MCMCVCVCVCVCVCMCGKGGGGGDSMKRGIRPILHRLPEDQHSVSRQGHKIKKGNLFLSD